MQHEGMDMQGVTVRAAADADAAAIAAIYNHYIEISAATFDTVPKTVDDRIAWIREHGDAYPVLVVERDGAVVAWGSLTRWSARPAWSGTVEVSVYVADGERGSGLGPLLLEELVSAGRRCGFHALVAQIVADNRPSIAMAERAGFELVGTLREVGWKFGRWHDVALVELILDTDEAGDGE